MIAAALAGGREIMDVYARDFAVAFKEDTSPLTEADKGSHDVIERILGAVEPGTPTLSEEGAHAPYEERASWESYYLIDPLDGTKEFVKRNGEFTVNIAWVARDVTHGFGKGGPLADEAGHEYTGGERKPVAAAEAASAAYSPLAGVVYAPYLEDLYVGVVGFEAWRVTGLPVDDPDARAIIATAVGSLADGAAPFAEPANTLRRRAESLPLTGAAESRPYTIVASRSHLSPETAAFIDERRRVHPGLKLVSAGSSLKLCRVADGSADEYPRFAPTNEWDTAAGDAVARAAGCSVTEYGPARDTARAAPQDHTRRSARDSARAPEPAPDFEGPPDHHGRPLRYNKRELLNPWFLVRRSSGV